MKSIRFFLLCGLALVSYLANAVHTIEVQNANDIGTESLNAAIAEANSVLDDVVITFKGDLTSISLTTALPEIDRAGYTTTIDGAVNGGKIEIIWVGSSTTTNGFVVRSNSVDFFNLLLEGFQKGILIHNTSAYSDVTDCEFVNCTYSAIQINGVSCNVKDCTINTNTNSCGIDIYGDQNQVVSGNHILSTSGYNIGIQIREGADFNKIGGPTGGLETANIIGGFNVGITIGNNNPPVSDGNEVQGNLVGRAFLGDCASGQFYGAPNADGIMVNTHATNAIIGKEGQNNESYANIVASNTENGIEVREGVQYLKIVGNYIGTDFCLNDLGNDFGVHGYWGNINYLQLGGEGGFDGNVIGFNNTGYYIKGGSQSIKGNFVGTDRGTQVALPNGKGFLIKGNNLDFSDNVVSGNSGYGLLAYGTSHEVINNKFGTDKTGLVAIPNLHGMEVYSTGLLLKDNVISGNNSHGAILRGIDMKMFGNLVGCGADGETSLPNQVCGIKTGPQVGANTGQASDQIVIGKPGEGNGNLIRFNGPETSHDHDGGLVLQNTKNVKVQNNVITDNNAMGIRVVQTAFDMLIGGYRDTEGNIFGNETYGVYVDNQSSNKRIKVQGNYFGYHPNNGLSMPTVIAFRSLSKPSAIEVGGTMDLGNVFGYNTKNAIRFDANVNTDNKIQGNFVGITPDLRMVMPNSTGYTDEAGIHVTGTNHVQIGGDSPGVGNTVAGNNTAGIIVRVGDYNVMRHNRFFHTPTGMKAISLVSSGSGNPGNEGMATPVLNKPVLSLPSHDLTISGTTSSATDNVIDVYKSTGSEEVLSWVGQTISSAGSWTFIISDYTSTDKFVAIATNPNGSSSRVSGVQEFSCPDWELVDPLHHDVDWPSQCMIEAVPYAHTLQDKLDSETSPVSGGLLRFYFRDDHSPNKDLISFKVLDYKNELVLQTGDPALEKVGRNLYALNVQGLSTDPTEGHDLYVLEVTDVSGHHHKLKFEVVAP